MSYRVDRCANQSCRTTIDLDWSAVACPCGAVVTCDGCDEIEACDTCRAAKHECAYDTPGAGPCETCVDRAAVEGALS